MDAVNAPRLRQAAECEFARDRARPMIESGCRIPPSESLNHDRERFRSVLHNRGDGIRR
jgi:hypothetical protein